jgi:LPPG:FO 2-phospho-L-lactate transferase
LFSDKKVVLLVGGVGGAKLAYGLAQILPPENLTIIVNTGDDFWRYGLRICPDLDTILYTLSGWVDKSRGWGLEDDTTVTLEALRRLDSDVWFRLGDRDLATHMFRTQLWHEGHSLTEITARLTKILNIDCRVLPMTDHPVATIVDTVEYDEIDFQTYFVKHRWQPQVRSLRLQDAEEATISDSVREAIFSADCIIIGPSNPWLSINPILSVPEMRQRLTDRPIPRVAVTPIISGSAVKGPTAKIMRELGHEVALETVTTFYGDVINGFVYDDRDTEFQVADLALAHFDTLMTNDVQRIQLATNIMNWIASEVMQAMTFR